MAKVRACEEYFEILNPGVMQSTFTLLVISIIIAGWVNNFVFDITINVSGDGFVHGGLE